MDSNEDMKTLIRLLNSKTHNIHFIKGIIKTLRDNQEKEKMIQYLMENENATMKDISFQSAVIIENRLRMNKNE